MNRRYFFTSHHSQLIHYERIYLSRKLGIKLLSYILSQVYLRDNVVLLRSGKPS